jgi:GTP-binding protein
MLERGRLLFAGPIEFLLSVVRIADLPVPDRAEVAFAGRSNVGKSSLINALTGRKSLARTSNTPGRTRELNFFDVGGDLYLVDMPGYGYARAPKTAIKAWTRLIRDYLAGRATLRRVFVLIDARHGIKPGDQEIMALLDRSAVIYQGVLTKTDKLSADELDKVRAATLGALAKRPAAHPELIATSSRTAQGIDVLRAEIAALIAPSEAVEATGD